MEKLQAAEDVVELTFARTAYADADNSWLEQVTLPLTLTLTLTLTPGHGEAAGRDPTPTPIPTLLTRSWRSCRRLSYPLPYPYP